MAKLKNQLLCFTTVLLCIRLCSGSQNITYGDPKVVQPNTWCVAKAEAPEEQLMDFIEFVRTEPKAIHCILLFFTPTQPCYEPNTIRDHASVCLNEFYKTQGPCHIILGQITNINPSHDKCIFT